MKKSIYEIEVKHLQLVETLEENGGELSAELEQELAINKEELQSKGVAYSFVIKDLKATVEQIDKELERLESLRNTKKKAIERLENSLSTAMQIFSVERIETPVVNISFRKSESVNIPDVKLLDRKYIKIKVTETPDKTQIMKDLKSGAEVSGATISYNKNLQIK